LGIVGREERMTGWQVGLAFYAIIIFFVFIGSIVDDFYDDMPISPKAVYDDMDELNMLGSSVIWLLCVLVNPIGYVCKFIGWIFTVGRK
jgi:hypothetical protein